MHITKRRLAKGAALVVATALAVTLAACTSGGGGDSGDKTLTIQSQWIKGNPMGDAFREVVTGFEEETGITLEIKDISDDAQPAFEADYVAGEEADVVILNLVGDNQGWVKDGLTMDVASLVDEWGLSDKFTPETLGQWTNADGQVSGFPYVGFVWPVWYNMAILEEAGVTEVPQTTDDLFAAAEAIRAIGKQPFVIGGGDWPGNNFFAWLVETYGGPDEGKKVAAEGGFCESDAVMSALALINTMKSNGTFADQIEGYTSDTMTTAYYNGDAAILPSGSWAFPNTPADLAANTVLGGFPVPSDGGFYDKPTAWFGDTGTGLWISRNGQAKMDLVQQFVEYLYRPESVQTMIDVGAMIPASIVEGASSEDPLLNASLSLRDSVQPIEVWDTYTPVGTDLGPIVTAAFGGQDPATTCQQMEDNYQAAING